MNDQDQKSGSDGAKAGKTGTEKPSQAEDCRCKETSRMSPAELLKLMMNDLAFWKKK